MPTKNWNSTFQTIVLIVLALKILNCRPGCWCDNWFFESLNHICWFLCQPTHNIFAPSSFAQPSQAQYYQVACISFFFLISFCAWNKKKINIMIYWLIGSVSVFVSIFECRFYFAFFSLCIFTSLLLARFEVKSMPVSWSSLFRVWICTC